MGNTRTKEMLGAFEAKLKMKTNFKMRRNKDECWGVWIQKKINLHEYTSNSLMEQRAEKIKSANHRELRLFKIELQNQHDLYVLAKELAKEWNGE